MARLQKKDEANYIQQGNDFEAVIICYKNYNATMYTDCDKNHPVSFLDSEYDTLDHIQCLDHPGVWVVKAQLMVDCECDKNESWVNGMYYNILEKKCIYFFGADA